MTRVTALSCPAQNTSCSGRHGTPAAGLEGAPLGAPLGLCKAWIHVQALRLHGAVSLLDLLQCGLGQVLARTAARDDRGMGGMHILGSRGTWDDLNVHNHLGKTNDPRARFAPGGG